MTLVLEVEFLSGVSFAAIAPDNEAPEWPPQPDRIFSALVATWAARGQQDDEAAALVWLEGAPSPRLAASEAAARSGALVYVPPNDPRSDKGKHARGVVPAFRGRQPRCFPAARPDNPTVRLLWENAAPPREVLEALQRLAGDTSYIGHSASLTRCRFLTGGDAATSENPTMPERSVYPGRFAELCQAYESKRRPLRGTRLTARHTASPDRANAFGERWLLLDHVAGEMPDLRASALVIKTLREALLSGYRRVGLEHAIPEVVSGHTPDRRPTSNPHMAIIPLPFVGFPHADGHIMGFALIPPSGSPILDDPDFRKVLRQLAPVDDDRGRRILPLRPNGATAVQTPFAVDLSPTFEAPAGRRSLDPSLYLGPARTFASVTPIVLDRHLKKKGAARQEEMTDQIATACCNIGLPEPETVVCDKHASIEGTASAMPSGKAPPWTGWRLPASLASRQLTHAVIRFAEPVHGPLLLGAGRFGGLGLYRPIDRDHGSC